jgi:hypothetical protein
VKHDPKDPSPRSGDDLFDLPRETAGGARPTVDSIASALPKRATPTAPAGPPLTNVEPTVAGILEQVRPALARLDAATATTAPTPALAISRRNLWIAFGAIATANALVIAFLFPSAETAEVAPHASPKPVARTSAPDPAPKPKPASKPGDASVVSAQHVATEPAPLPVFSGSPVALELARQALDEARTDLAAGRRSAARSRLGRIGLAIDAIDPSEREALRAEVALLIARSVQADAEEAGASK